jgi:7,8-dihydropterin-6-yl-methyl-4-(beta-D-ribofuranosyl)aminobenzene 5'-phosphate synthase
MTRLFGGEFGEAKKAVAYVLADNFVPAPGKFVGEYGFSMFLKIYGDEEIGLLLDTGAGYAIENNFSAFDLCWDEVDYIVLSHRHFDHTGGLLKVLDNVNAPIIAHPNLFKPSFLWVRNKLVDGSFPFPESSIKNKARLYLVKDPFKIANGVVVSGEIPRVTEFEKTPETFKIEDGKLVHDEMNDDFSIYIKTKNGLSVITGCAHSGVVNVIKHAESLAKESPRLVAGGFHLIFSGEDRIKSTLRELEKIEVIAPCHCTGLNVCGAIMGNYPSKYLQLGVGVRFEL